MESTWLPPTVSVEVITWPVNQLEPQVVEFAFGCPRVRTRSFPIFDAHSAAHAPREWNERRSTRELPRIYSKHTRFRPPRDVIRLKDRLSYVLQPSLETTLSRGRLEFPFDPFPYQMEGIAFLFPRQAALLADEMGLGKTMQAITALRLLIHAGEVRRALIVCPKPLVTNWLRELGQWAPEIPCASIGGERERRAWQWAHPHSVISVANYEVLQRDREILDSEQVEFDLVILDESQRIKNPHSATNEAARSIKRRRSWALTGTPIENGTQDLIGIFEFLMPGYLSRDLTPSRMADAASDYLLRRTKDRVLEDLPPKLIRDAEVDLTPVQRRLYDLAEREGILRLTELGDAIRAQHVFELILRLKQLCNFDPATGSSAKFEQLEADLDEIAESGKKAIVFSQWVTTLDWLAGRLQRFNPLPYHGRVSPSRRDEIIQLFKDSPRHHVLLMSYGAGSVGLNLQNCQYVFLFDRWWNPAVEDQAINRAHRIGAQGTVTVTRFLTRGTIEERIDEILQSKRDVCEQLFSSMDTNRRVGLSQEELFGLFQLRSPSSRFRKAA